MSMSETSPPLQEFLEAKFQAWQPPAAAVLGRTRRSVTLQWGTEPFGFLAAHLLFRVQRQEKMPPWVTVYCGGKTTKTIDDLAPGRPHKFRLQIILKSTSVSLLAEAALQHHSDESTVYEVMKSIPEDSEEQEISADKDEERNEILSKTNGHCKPVGTYRLKSSCLTSRWSEETWSSTDSDGTSIACFCMAVRCGYFKQAAAMAEARPELVEAINPSSGLTALATALRKGDVNTVKFVLSLGADVDRPSAASQAPLHLAALSGNTALVDLLLGRGADFQARDFNGLRVEHYAVESCSLDMLTHVLDRGGDVTVADSNGWTPLFRAVCQGASTALVEELVRRGSSALVSDRRGLALASAARLLSDRQGRPRDSVLRLVDPQYPHEKAVANFTRLTKKIYSVHTLLK